jgi:hypothetical protein
MERELTRFQTDCERRLTTALAQVGRRVAGRRLDGISETYITGKVEDRDITFWIYRDGADFEAGNLHPLFERPDFDSLDELAGAFVEQLLGAAA